MMKRAMLVTALVAGTAVLGFGLARDQGTAKAPSAAEQRNAKSPADEQAIRAIVAAFTKAFDKHDADAIAALFIPEGKMITEDGEVIEGRKAISAAFAEQFTESPKSTITVNVDSIKLIGSDLAIEVGSTRVTHGPGQEPELNRYTAVHVKRDGKWMMALARDEEGPPASGNDRLQPLAWLVGDWIDESPEAVVMTSCKWSADKNFLLQDIQVTTAGKTTMTIQQRIGWDGLQKCIHSWFFDSEGGFGEGLWARDDDSWMIKATGVRNDGSTASATNTITRAGKDAYVWRSADRVLGGSVGSPIEVRVVRKPPAAGATKN
jgi:uncharacterized protein (TIGR02246 family)